MVGSGGREHALLWRIAQGQKDLKLFCAPGNAGTSQLARPVPIQTEDISGLASFVQAEKVDLTVVGPEGPLAAGIVDHFRSKGLSIFGPPRAAARLEGSKIFAKQLMKRLEVPTAPFEIFGSSQRARAFLQKRSFPCVVKADGLCQGKGVFVVRSKEEALEAVEGLMVKKDFGEAGNQIIIEDCLEGEEVSVLAFCDGRRFQLLPSSQDHKRIFETDQGPNTGGMGAYSPAIGITGAVEEAICEKILEPILAGLEKEGNPYRGLLYAGLMLTQEGPKVLEFNVRFGDPETQAVLPRVEGNFLGILQEAATGNLTTALTVSQRPCVSVVAASTGYPGSYEKGKSITGLEQASQEKDCFLFHAGTVLKDGRYATNGGRVLAVSALGRTLQEAVDRAYQALSLIHFDGMYYRRDIAHRALQSQNEKVKR